MVLLNNIIVNTTMTNYFLDFIITIIYLDIIDYFWLNLCILKDYIKVNYELIYLYSLNY